MLDPIWIFIAAVFVLAGFVKGVIGLGLPTVSMGLLAIVMPPAQAAAILMAPSLVTNFWQAVSGRHLRPVMLRLWSMMLGVCIGTWAGAGLITGADARYGAAILGLALSIYAVAGLASIRLSVGAYTERWLGPVAGFFTGVINAGTGVSVIPSAPFLQAIGLQKDELVQALGLTFTVSTMGLAFNLAAAHALTPSLGIASLAALPVALVGVWLGQIVRRRLRSEAFRFWFFVGILGLGLYLMARLFL
jgi:uncharacterized membrane protein YfcA